MILTPKNWKSFQHYKDRDPPWIKLHRGLLNNYEFFSLPVASRALAPLLWLIASENEDGKIVTSLDALAFRLHMTRGDLADALSPLVQSGFFETSESMAQDASKTQATCPPETEAQVKTEKKSRAASPSNEDFEEFKKVYPKRAGNYGWKAAERKYLALVKTGVSPQAINTAAKRHAEEMRKLKRLGTEFVPMPASWLNAEDFVFVAVNSFNDEPKQIDWDNIVSFYKRTKVWTRDVGPDPESPACQAPEEILRKHGIQPTGASHG
jgi:hypothetical protein